MRRLIITSPYPEEADKLEKTFFEKNGFSIINVRGLGIKEGYKFAQVAKQEIYRLGVDAWTGEAECLLISCMNFNAIPVIYALELALKVPVVTSVSATLWKILQILGVEESILGYERLLEEHIQVK